MTIRVDFTVNDRPVRVEADGSKPLLSVLRDELGLRGTHFGCGTEQCGACMVLIDGEPQHSCAREVATVAGRSITTVEGLSQNGKLHPLQQAFLDEQAGQCGYCLTGIIMRAKALLDANPSATRTEIAEALDGNLCRCGSHPRILRAVARAAEAIRQAGP